MSKHTAFISFDGLSDPLGQSQILPYLIGIAQTGFKVHVLSCEKPARLAAAKSYIESTLAEHGIEWQYVLYDEDGNWRSRWQYTRQLRNMALALHRKHSLALIHCRSYLAALTGLFMHGRHNIPFIFDMRGFWADERIDGGIWKLSHPIQWILYRYFKHKERILLTQAAAVISLTTAGLNELCRLYPNLHLEKKTSIIPCCTNTALFDPEKISAASIPNLPTDAELLVYTGSIGTWYYTQQMIDCICAWQALRPNIRLLILTKDQSQLNTILSTLPAEQRALIISAEADHKQVPQYLKCAKAAIFFIKPAYSKIASSPTKMAECWSMNLPIITNNGIGDNDYYFNQFNAGVLVNEFTPSAYAKAFQDFNHLRIQPGHLRHLAIQEFDHALAVQRYTQVYERLLGPTKTQH